MTHEDYMHRALALARKGLGRTSPNPVVGAVVVRSGRIVGEGWHKRCGGPHAEVFALNQAGEKARGATLYLTLEPCFHIGRTPACVEAVMASGIKTVFVGMKDLNPKTNGKSIRKMQRAGIRVETGLLKGLCLALNEPFVKYVTTGRPFVTAKIAQTFDGKIATASGDSKWITSEAARRYARQRRDAFDAIMVGINTVRADNPALTPASKTKRLKKIVVDSSLGIGRRARLFENTRSGEVIVVTTTKAPETKVRQLQRSGVQVWIAPERGGHVDLVWTMKELAKQEIIHILIEGGGRLIGRALHHKLVDKMMIYLAPKLIGDQDAVSSVAGLNVKRIGKALTLHNLTWTVINPDILVEAYVHRDC